MYYENVWDLMFLVFFCDALENYCTFLAEFSFFFSKTTEVLQQSGTNGHSGCSFICLLLLLVSVCFATRSTVFENFGRGFLNYLFFISSNIKCAKLR